MGYVAPAHLWSGSIQVPIRHGSSQNVILALGQAPQALLQRQDVALHLVNARGIDDFDVPGRGDKHVLGQVAQATHDESTVSAKDLDLHSIFGR